MIPSPSEYRLNENQIDRSGTVCMARILGDYLTCDTRWKPHVYYEAQCDRAPVVGEDLCKTCRSRERRTHKLWVGRITEDPLDHCHMLGTEWGKKCKWLGDVLPSHVVEAPPVPEEYPTDSKLHTGSDIEDIIPMEPGTYNIKENILYVVSAALLAVGIGFSVYYLSTTNSIQQDTFGGL